MANKALLYCAYGILTPRLRHEQRRWCVAPPATKVLQSTKSSVSVDLSLKMRYLTLFIYFLVQSVFGEEDPSFAEENNDIPEGKSKYWD